MTYSLVQSSVGDSSVTLLATFGLAFDSSKYSTAYVAFFDGSKFMKQSIPVPPEKVDYKDPETGAVTQVTNAARASIVVINGLTNGQKYNFSLYYALIGNRSTFLVADTNVFDAVPAVVPTIGAIASLNNDDSVNSLMVSLSNIVSGGSPVQKYYLYWTDVTKDPKTGAAIFGNDGTVGFGQYDPATPYVYNATPSTASNFGNANLDGSNQPIIANPWFKISGLTNLASYEISGSAINAVGLGPMSVTVVDTPSNTPAKIANSPTPPLITNGDSSFQVSILQPASAALYNIKFIAVKQKITGTADTTAITKFYKVNAAGVVSPALPSDISLNADGSTVSFGSDPKLLPGFLAASTDPADLGTFVILITGLTNGKSYDMNFSLVNVNGMGPFMDNIINASPNGIPSAPRNLKAQRLAADVDGNVKITWDEPASNWVAGGGNQSYKVLAVAADATQMALYAALKAFVGGTPAQTNMTPAQKLVSIQASLQSWSATSWAAPASTQQKATLLTSDPATHTALSTYFVILAAEVVIANNIAGATNPSATNVTFTGNILNTMCALTPGVKYTMSITPVVSAGGSNLVGPSASITFTAGFAVTAALFATALQTINKTGVSGDGDVKLNFTAGSVGAGAGGEDSFSLFRYPGLSNIQLGLVVDAQTPIQYPLVPFSPLMPEFFVIPSVVSLKQMGLTFANGVRTVSITVSAQDDISGIPLAISASTSNTITVYQQPTIGQAITAAFGDAKITVQGSLIPSANLQGTALKNITYFAVPTNYFQGINSGTFSTNFPTLTQSTATTAQVLDYYNTLTAPQQVTLYTNVFSFIPYPKSIEEPTYNVNYLMDAQILVDTTKLVNGVFTHNANTELIDSLAQIQKKYAVNIMSLSNGINYNVFSMIGFDATGTTQYAAPYLYASPITPAKLPSKSVFPVVIPSDKSLTINLLGNDFTNGGAPISSVVVNLFLSGGVTPIKTYTVYPLINDPLTTKYPVLFSGLANGVPHTLQYIVTNSVGQLTSNDTAPYIPYGKPVITSLVAQNNNSQLVFGFDSNGEDISTFVLIAAAISGGSDNDAIRTIYANSPVSAPAVVSVTGFSAAAIVEISNGSFIYSSWSAANSNANSSVITADGTRAVISVSDLAAIQAKTATAAGGTDWVALASRLRLAVTAVSVVYEGGAGLAKFTGNSFIYTLNPNTTGTVDLSKGAVLIAIGSKGNSVATHVV